MKYSFPKPAANRKFLSQLHFARPFIIKWQLERQSFIKTKKKYKKYDLKQLQLIPIMNNIF